MEQDNKQWEMLGLAIEIAADAHSEQLDKGGKPYILHPLHLMNQLMYDPELAQIAVMHDVIEDSNFTLVVLLSHGFSRRVRTALQLLTHSPEDSYLEYIVKVGTSLDAITVKRKDLEHNSCITRLKGVTDKDLARAKKYHLAFLYLGKARDDIKGSL